MVSEGDGGPRPNILFVFPDQWRFDCLGALGHPSVETPFLDQMAAEGVVFSHAYTPCMTCIAARASLATGLSPSNTGRMGYRDGLPWPYANTFMRLLRDAGYQTMCAGKTHFWPARVRLGFEELALYEMPWQERERPSDYHCWLAQQTAGRVRDTADGLDSNSWIDRPWTHGEELHPSTWTTDAAIGMLERRDTTRPFFLQVGYHRPHPPLDPPLTWYERLRDAPLPPVPVGDWAGENDVPVRSIRHDRGKLAARQLDRTRRAYFAQISHLDSQVGRLVRFLEGHRLMESTWIVFASDHGEMLGDHHLFRKTCAFEGSAHIPMVIRPAGWNRQGLGSLCESPVTLTDLAPTFLELGGATSPDAMDGISLLAWTRGEHPRRREYVHGEHVPGWQYVTDGCEKLIWHSRDDRRWFFDLQRDPCELHDLSNDATVAERVGLWERRLVDTLATRTDDGLVEDGALVPGSCAPVVRQWILDAGGRGRATG